MSVASDRLYVPWIVTVRSDEVTGFAAFQETIQAPNDEQTARAVAAATWPLQEIIDIRCRWARFDHAR